MDCTQNNGSRLCKKGCCRNAGKLHTYDWLCDIPEAEQVAGFVEVQFKNTRKGYYANDSGIALEKGDVVAVEASPGHDIGTVTLTGKLVLLQMCKNNLRIDNGDIKRVYRIAMQPDLDRYAEAKAREHVTMIRSRRIAESLGLAMKIGDVEYQGDGLKAIFYYLADERVDFRQLIRVLAETFRIRIEMKQIGSRQEAGRIGGIGSCGRELCCSSWMTDFVSVSTDAARFQDISMNPQKLAGQCAKLKCCFNYEVDAYVEALKQMPFHKTRLETEDRIFYHFKTDAMKREITYSTDEVIVTNCVVLPYERALEVMKLNRKGIRPKTLTEEADAQETPPPQPEQQDLPDGNGSRFDPLKKKRKKRPEKSKARPPQDVNEQDSPVRERADSRKQPKNKPPRGITHATRDE
jgi:cell fate regulator YaaT (PSP1 superfamily)